MSVVNGVSIPESNLLNNHLGICYHAVREKSAAGIWKVDSVKGNHSIANFLTKTLYVTSKEKEVEKCIWRK